jgi:hypothetical protein
MRIFFLILSALMLLTSCDEGKKAASAPKKSQTLSAPYELLLVANKEWLKTSNGSVFMDAVNQDIPGLPQKESNFRLTTINPSAFNGTFTVYANIIHVDINKKHKEAKFVVSRDVYVKPQIILNIQAPNEMELIQLVQKGREHFLDVFINAELERERNYLSSTYSGIVHDAVKKKFGYTIKAPKDLDHINKESEDFLWSSANGRSNELNLCVYTYPYTSDSTFTLKYFAHKRDSVMGINVRGENDNQYMVTEPRAISEKHKNGQNGYIYEVRGLWEMENDMMGGPFISYSQVDTKKNLVVVVEGFVYAPKKEKRELIRELEASLMTLQLDEKQ